MSDGSDNRPRPLHELRVVEISDRIAGSYCGKLLVDAGARYGNSNHRKEIRCGGTPPPAPAPDGSDDSPLFSYLNAGKRSMTIAEDSERYRADLPRRRRDRHRRPVAAAARASIHSDCWPTAAGRRRHHLRLRLDRPVRRPRRQRVHLAGLAGLDRASVAIPPGRPISIGGDLGEYMGGACAAFGALAVRRRVAQRRSAAGTSTCPCSRR